MCLAAVSLVLMPAGQRPQERRRGPVAVGSLLASNTSIEFKVEVPPAGFDFATPVAIKWAPHPEECVEVHMQSFSPEGQTLETMKCGIRSPQFVLKQGLQGQIRWAGHPEYCLSAPGHGVLKLQKCADLSAATSEFNFADGRIHVKATPSECVVVDSHSTDKHGRHDVAIQDCHAWDGDSLFPPDEVDFKFVIDWPAPETTAAPTTEAPTTAAPTTKAPTTAAPTTEAPTTAAPTTKAPTTKSPARATAAPQPQPKHLPSRVILQSHHKKYVVAELGGGIFANRLWADCWEKFSVVELGEGSVAFKSYHGYYLTASMLGLMSATATEVVDDAHFNVEHRDSGAIALKTAYGKYVAAEPSGVMIGNREGVDDWEEFEVIDMADKWPDHVAIKSPFGTYLRAYPHGALKADGFWPFDDWEIFQVTHYDDGTISLRCDHGEYMAVGDDGMIHASSSASGTEHFTVVHLPDGNFTMQSHTGGYVWAHQHNFEVKADFDKVHEWAKFQVVMVY